MSNWLERSELLISPDKLAKLKKAHVLIVGLGGIGSFAAEFIARAGVGEMTIIDGDVFDPTNNASFKSLTLVATASGSFSYRANSLISSSI